MGAHTLLAGRPASRPRKAGARGGAHQIAHRRTARLPEQIPAARADLHAAGLDRHVLDRQADLRLSPREAAIGANLQIAEADLGAQNTRLLDRMLLDPDIVDATDAPTCPVEQWTSPQIGLEDQRP